MVTNPHAKQILVYGDSYTFGKIPGGLRHDATTRFTGVLQTELGSAYEVVGEGLRGRCLSGENIFFPERNGLEQFGPIFASHVPLDIVVFFLGTNDCNSGGNLSPELIVGKYGEYLKKISWWCEHLGFPEPKILLVAPPNIDEKASYSPFKDIFKGSEKKINKLPKLIKEFANSHNILFFDSSPIIRASKVDGIHLDEDNNRVLGTKLAEFIKKVV